MPKTTAAIAFILVTFAALACAADKAAESADASSAPLSDGQASISDGDLHGYTKAEIINLYKAEVRKNAKHEILVAKLQHENSQLRGAAEKKGVLLGETLSETEEASNQVVALSQALALARKGDAPLRVNDCQIADGCCVAKSLESQLCPGVSVDEVVPGDGGAAQEGSTFVPPCADDPNCNPAKCAGDTQDNTVLRGDLDCESGPLEGKEMHKGSSCIDNLSSGKFYVSGGNGQGQCVDFGQLRAFRRLTFRDYKPKTPRAGTLSKLITAHPDKTAKRYGLIFGKRIRCIGTACHAFKQGLCIKCPAEVFKSNREHRADADDFAKFHNCCIRGLRKYKVENGTQIDCIAKFWEDTSEGPSGAFTARNSADAVLKPSYHCWDGQSTVTNERDADGKWGKTGKVALELAEDLMKAG
jgi:hypothetical protein